MTTRSVVLNDTDRPLNRGTSRKVVAAQLRAESRADSTNPKALVRAVAAELRASGFEPDLHELQRRYVGTAPVVSRSGPSSMSTSASARR
jgi:hypothetical protein